MTIDALGNIIDPNKKEGEDESLVTPQFYNPTQGEAPDTGTLSGSPVSQAKPPSSSGFTNLQAYLGASQKSPLTSTVGKGLGQLSSGLQSGIQQAEQKTQQGITQGTVNYDPNVAKGIIDAARYGVESPDQTKEQPPGTPGSFGLPTPEQYGTFAGYTGAQYKGPTELANKYNLQSQLGQLQNLSNVRNPDVLLQRFVGQGQYTPGQMKLDKLIFGQTVNPRQYRNIASQAGTSLGQAQRNALLGIQAGQRETAKTREQSLADVNAALGNVIPTGETDTSLLGTLGRTAKETQDYQQQLRDYLAGADFNQQNIQLPEEYMKSLGLTPGQDISGLTSQDILQQLSARNFGITPLTPEDIASQQDLARYNALTKLSGQPDKGTLYGGKSLGQFNREVESGKLTTDELKDVSERAQKQFEGNNLQNAITAQQISDWTKNNYGSEQGARERLAELNRIEENYRFNYGGGFHKGSSEEAERGMLIGRLRELDRLGAGIEALKQQYGIGRTVGQPINLTRLP